MNSSPDFKSIFNNINADCTHIGCVDKLNTWYFIMLQGFRPETAVETQNKTTEKIAKSYS